MFKKLAALTLILGAIAFAAAPLPDTSYINGTKWIDIDSRPNALTGDGNGGGRFEGTVSTTVNSFTNPVQTNFWCIDSQLTVSVPASADNANIYALNNITGNESKVRYASGVTFTNNLGGVYGYQDRIKMAAYLISQYTPDPQTGPANITSNQSIQGAIWAIMHNSINGGGSSSISANEQTWITNAIANFASVDTSRWAVVSWAANADGTMQANDQRQTFLVEVVPEPGFYGALALGLSGLYFFVARKRAPKA